MEESPHKCPVCNRSFNQRSNLKTHLLTHTDHKPYECSSCGKVFRRNCDLRRHALTHAVGDVPTEVLDVGDDDRHLSGDEEDTVLEVDSPVHSPVTRARSPSPTPEIQDPVEVHHEPTVDVDEEEVIPVVRPEQEPAAVTHCHHERSGGSSSPYTMRPQHDYPRDYRAIHQGLFLPPSQQDQQLQQNPDVFVPMLHVRRDLHHKIGSMSRISSTMTSGLLEPGPSFLSSIPLRKRPIGLDGEPHPILGRNLISSHHLGHNLLHRQQQLMKPPDDLLLPPILSPDPTHEALRSPAISTQPQSVATALAPSPASSGSSQSSQLQSPPLLPPIISMPSQISGSSSSILSPSGSTSSKSLSIAASLPAPAVAPPAPRKTGFSIEDIMRR